MRVVRQFIRFGIVGFSNTILSYIVYFIALFVLRKCGWCSSIDYLVAQIMMFIVGVMWSFFWNRRYVFQIQAGGKGSILKSLVKTYIMYSFTGLFLSGILLIMWVQVFHISEFIAPVINLAVTVPLNFVLAKVWAFK